MHTSALFVRRALASALVGLAAVAAIVVPASPASASLASIICGGVKHGSGWQTYPSGGYSGAPCGPGIDWINTPTTATSTYHFGSTGTRVSITFDAWIPSTHATAYMNFDLYCDGVFEGTKAVDEAPISGWTNIFDFSPLYTCNDMYITARSGQASVKQLGLDAIRSGGF